MKRYISILRGINVGGLRQIKMDPLKSLYEKLAFHDVETYIRSGNVLFSTVKKDTRELERLIEAEILRQFGFEVPVLVLSGEELEKVFRENPFLVKQNVDINCLHVTLLADRPEQKLIDDLSGFGSNGDEFVIVGKSVYLFCPNGYGRTKLTNTFFERKLKTRATTRNWKTIGKLLALSAEK